MGGIGSSRETATDSNIPFAKICNFRDLGDIAVGEGRRTKRGVIYRSARTTACSVGDVDVLTKKFGIQTIVDLRGPPRHGKLKEATEDGLDALFGAYPPQITIVGAEEDGTKNQSRSMQQLAYVDKRVKAAIKEHIGILGTAVLFLVYFSLKAMSIMKIIAKPLPPLHHAVVWAVARCKFFALTLAIEHWGGFGTLYYLIAKHNSKAVKRCLDICANVHRQPVLFHCASGKDRTGITAALILYAAGVSRKEIIHEYSLSHSWALEYYHIRHIIGVDEDECHYWLDWIASSKSADSKSGAAQALGAPKVSIKNFFELIDSDFGSINAYLTWIGCDDDWRQKFRRNFTQ